MIMFDDIITLQSEKVSKLMDLLPNKSELTFKAPTGSGKTYMMADFMNRVLETDKNIIFLVSCLSKGNLYKQNYDKFCEYKKDAFKNLNPYLISTDISTEGNLYIPDNYNVYVLPRDLYKEKGILKQGAFINFLERITNSIFGLGKQVYLIKDECHQATNNLDELSGKFFLKVFNFSATPDSKRGQVPDVEMTENEAQKVNLIKRVEYLEGELEEAIVKFIDLKAKYEKCKIGVNPCLMIQISNTGKAEAEIDKIIEAVENSGLKYVLMTKNPKEYRTNDFFKAKKLPTSRWEGYVKSNSSLIDVAIFKLKISEGWDIPRACMLYQVRDTMSKQLDEQVIGRIRRNPCINKLDTFSKDVQEFLMTSYAFNIKPKDSRIARQVKLCPEGENIKVKTTCLRNPVKDKNFDISTLLRNETLTHSDIFTLYKQLKKTSVEIQELFKNYSTDVSTTYSFLNNLNAIFEAESQYIENYEHNMEIGEEVAISSDSYFMETDAVSRKTRIDNWIWKRVDDSSSFEFDSDAEKEWADKLLSAAEKQNIAGIMEAENGQKVYLIGKNFYPNSEIKFEYYLNGIHSSYPDFIMKDNFGRVHIFEVKSLLRSNNNDIDEGEYTEKIKALMKCYKEASAKTGQWFYIPIRTEESWFIYRFKPIEENLSEQEEISFETFIKDIKCQTNI